ncbi:acyltransferase family protein [Galbibacter marinus]|nr:heparan-alpha-glucosaminide N-acetyltransferase domain-containing protein [Galbibacter marinus]
MSALKQRYLSLDVLRGLTLFLMIIVNTPGSWGSVYRPLSHASWHGFTLTDLVFPTFLFVVGNAMSFSMRKFEQTSQAAFLKKVIKRTFVIFAIGFLLSWFPFFRDGQLKPLEDARIFGVLQRIALCYFFASLVIHYFKIKGALVFSMVALLGYHLIMYTMGDYTLEGNAALKLDLWLLGPNHLYQGEGIPFDPEGLLSTLPATVNVIFGYFAGLFLQQSGKNFKTIALLMIGGATLVFLALGWDLLFPINKKIWTSSYVLLTVGIDVMVLAFLVYGIEILQKKKWTYFFEVLGKNPLFIYILSGLFVKLLFIFSIEGSSSYGWIAENLFMSWLGDYFGSFVFAVCFTMILWGIAYVMDKRKIYIKV